MTTHDRMGLSPADRRLRFLETTLFVALGLMTLGLSGLYLLTGFGLFAPVEAAGPLGKPWVNLMTATLLAVGGIACFVGGFARPTAAAPESDVSRSQALIAFRMILPWIVLLSLHATRAPEAPLGVSLSGDDRDWGWEFACRAIWEVVFDLVGVGLLASLAFRAFLRRSARPGDGAS